jgi:hypothetical protein
MGENLEKWETQEKSSLVENIFLKFALILVIPDISGLFVYLLSTFKNDPLKIHY